MPATAMIRFIKILLFTLILYDVYLVIRLLIGNSTVALLDPKGQIALQQRDITISAILIMLIIVIPVLIAMFYFAWKYREGNTHSSYKPEASSNRFQQALWWIAPSIIILVLSVMNWNATHALDPYKPIPSDKKPVTIQVIAMQWKWLFIYPEYGVASLNTVHFPEDTPIVFELTADGPMSSFWIPQLAGQMYAMTGMGTKIHMIANESGTYNGSSAEINGYGFAGMIFTAHVSSDREFFQWIQSVKRGTTVLDTDGYKKLALPSEYVQPQYFSSVQSDLYNEVIRKFMGGHETDVIDQPENKHTERMEH